MRRYTGDPEAGVKPSPKPQLTVSVLIVTFNSEREIGVCLQSVIPQVVSIGGEVIVVDNASSDGTTGVIVALQRDDVNLQLVTNTENLGFSHANNQALEMAEGEFVFLLNPDTELGHGTIDKLVTGLSDDAQLGAIAPQLRLPDGPIQHSCRRFPTYGAVISELMGFSRLFPSSRIFNGWKMGDFDHSFFREVDQPAAAALMIQGNLVRELGGFDEEFPMFFGDVDLCRRIWQTKKILFCPEAVVSHHGGASVNPEKPRMIVSSHVSFIRYFKKHHKGLADQVMNVFMAILLYLSMIFRVLWAAVRLRRTEARRSTL